LYSPFNGSRKSDCFESSCLPGRVVYTLDQHTTKEPGFVFGLFFLSHKQLKTYYVEIMEKQLTSGQLGQNNALMNSKNWTIIGAFAAVYLIWGSTYYGIKIAIHTLPPFIMASSRFLIAGILLFAFTAFKYKTLPKLVNWKESAILGFFMLLIGNGGVVWASDKLPSGIIALFITIEPIWIVLLLILKDKGKLPGYKTIIGSILGLIGAFILIAPGITESNQSLSIEGLLAILLSTIFWAIGSLIAVKSTGISVLMATAMQMICGSIFMLVVALFRGEFSALDISKFSNDSILAFLYLVFFGSIIGYSSYAYLLQKTTPSQVSTYAFVNPFVAVFIGSIFGGEPFTAQIGLAFIFMIAGVILVLSKSSK
jgi:drug/metabolite transporter (DMT)-like permease